MIKPVEKKILGYQIAWVDRNLNEEGCGVCWPPPALPDLVRMVDHYNKKCYFEGKEYFVVTVYEGVN